MIHQYINNGYHIVMDVNSGSVHVMDKLAYDAVPIVERLSGQGMEDKEDIARILSEELSVDSAEASEAVEEILFLKEQGQLFTEDIYENYIDAFQNRETVVKALCLHIAHDCNLACKYCFAGEGEYHGDRALMSLDVGKKALDFLVANSGSQVNLEVDFFGGEPLMNWQVVKELVA